jgi:16S rRNA (guanine966-N2)-methyltransferase|tara:strand:+ start:486 stop:1052 length:567 start_codon:yes stop_codon:yes gene_type:complete
MRIIGGVYKGVKIFEAFDKNTRPLKDLVKESILNILEFSKDSRINLNNSLVLDLFSGTGSFGLECISRGAAKVYFIENYTQSLEILHKNIKKLKCEKKTRVFNEDAFNFFENEELKNEKLDLIFLDPPYKEKNIKIILENIAKLKVLKESGLVVLHRHKKTKDDIGKKFTVKRSVKYGISKIIFVKIN